MTADILIFFPQNIKDEDLLFQDQFIPELLKEKLNKLNCVKSIYQSIPHDYTNNNLDDSATFIRKGIDDVNFWKEIFDKTKSDHIAVIRADAPFIDSAVIEDMISIHTQYMAEYTYSENLPEGLRCDIISAELMKEIPPMSEDTLSLAQVIKGNINRFDVELYYKGPDIRDKRLSFLSSSVRDKRIMENLTQINESIPSYENIKDLIEKNPESLFIGPSYIEVELTGACDSDCLFCYRKSLSAENGDMNKNLFKKIINDMNDFKLPYTLCFGGSGEPLQHPHFYEIIDIALNETLCEKIIVETNGRKADSNYCSLLPRDESQKIITVVNLSAASSEAYKTLHGNDDYEDVVKNCKAIHEKGTIYLQILKINETEKNLDEYYDLWEPTGIPIILQKQNTWLGRIEDRRYSDLTPLERTPCWHLQRDLFILSDGSVAYCKEDVESQNKTGSSKDEPLIEIWKKQKENFLNNYKGIHPASPDCKSCDEWYTFNF
jgi:spiro-SPASM protein